MKQIINLLYSKKIESTNVFKCIANNIGDSTYINIFLNSIRVFSSISLF